MAAMPVCTCHLFGANMGIATPVGYQTNLLILSIGFHITLPLLYRV